jgi:hypothetical protein
MSYECPLNPPHVDARGDPLIHKNRKECVAMGRKNRGAPTLPAKAKVPVDLTVTQTADANTIPPNSQAAGVNPVVVEGPKVPMAVDSSVPTTAAAPASVKKKKFSILKRKSEALPESETQAEAEAARPAWQLGSEPTIMFWTTILSLLRGGIEFTDKAIKAEHPYDTKQLEFTASEEKMVGEAMPGITTRILKFFGVKSVEAAEAFIHGMVILRIFGRIFLSIGVHFYDEARLKGQKKRAEREGEKAIIDVQAKVLETKEVASAPNPVQGLG